MAKREILAGSTNQTIDVVIEDVNGSPLTGLAYNSSGLTCYYREGATGAATQLTLATQTVGGAHSDGGFVEIDATNMPGLYRLDLSDTMVSDAGTTLIVLNGYAGMAPCRVELEVVSVAAGITAALIDGVWDEVLSAAAHNVASSAGRRLRNLGAFVVEDGTAQSGAATSITLAAGASALDSYYDLDVISIVDGTGAGQSRLIVAYNGTTKVASVYRPWVTNPDNTSVYVIEGKTELLVRNSGLATAGGANTITLAATASATNDTYIGETVILLAGTGASQARVITGYNGTTKVATVTDAWATNPDNTTVYAVLPLGRAFVIDIDTDSVAKVADGVWDEARAGHVAAGSFGEGVVVNSTAAGAITAASIATGAIDADALATDAVTEIVNAIIAIDVDGQDLQEALKIALAILAGKSSGLTDGYGTAVFRDIADTKNRATIAISSDGNRTASTLDGT